MCVLLVEGYLLQRTRDKRRAINMSPTWSRSRVVMSPGETPRDGYHPISHVLVILCTTMGTFGLFH